MWVHVIHVSDGILPSDLATGDADQIEEERRLLYVACTRPESISTCCILCATMRKADEATPTYIRS